MKKADRPCATCIFPFSGVLYKERSALSLKTSVSCLYPLLFSHTKPEVHILTLAWLISSPTKVDTNTEPDTAEPFRRMSCFRKGKALAGGSSGMVTVYDCRMLRKQRRRYALHVNNKSYQAAYVLWHELELRSLIPSGCLEMLRNKPANARSYSFCAAPFQ